MADNDATSKMPAAVPESSSVAVPVKPALVTEKKKKKKDDSDTKHLKWDEEAIEEHDLLRGTRMKIDEPNTPYTHYDSGAESDDSRRPKSPATQKPTICWDVLQTKLDSVAAVREAYPPSSPSSHGANSDYNDDDIQQQIQEEKKAEMAKLEFQEHRKRHYNEMELVRKFREEHPNFEDDEEDEADDES